MNTEAVWDEAFKQFRKSVGTKILLFVVALGALGVLHRLDDIKQELKKTKEKPYQATAAAAAFPKGTLGSSARALGNAGYDSADALFEALYAKTTLPGEREAKIRAAFATFAQKIAARNQRIEVMAAEPAATDKPAQLEVEIARRDSLVGIRNMQVEEIERDAAEAKANLRKAFDSAAIRRYTFNFFSSDALNRVGQRFADAEDPVSVVFDILWYAALIIGVICIVALILTPVFRALPVTGTEEKFWDQIKGILGKAPRVARGMTGIAAVAAGTLAVVATANSATSSPAKQARIFTRRAYLPPAEPPIAGDPAPRQGSDPRIEKLLAEVASLHDTDANHERSLLDQGKTLGEHGRTLADHAKSLEPLIPLPGRLVSVEQWVNGFEPAEERRIAAATDRVYGSAVMYADKKDALLKDVLEFQIDQTNQRVENTEKIVNTEARNIEAHAELISNGVFQPYLIGDRPSAVRTLFGFDRYRANAATELILQQNKADSDIVNAVSSLRRVEKPYTQSDFLRTLRVWTCHDQHNSCDAYEKWYPIVLRTARM